MLISSIEYICAMKVIFIFMSIIQSKTAHIKLCVNNCNVHFARYGKKVICLWFHEWIKWRKKRLYFILASHVNLSLCIFFLF